MGKFSFSLKVKKGKASIYNCKSETATSTGSGSGCNCPMQGSAIKCAKGFTKVCPMIGDTCPEDMDMVCPVNTRNRMATKPAYGDDEGCQCVPDFFMSLVVPGMLQAASGRIGATDRKVVKATIKVGKRQC